MPQPSGNGTQFAGDAPTQLLVPVGKGGGCGRPYCDLQRRFGAEHGHFDDRRHPPYLRLIDQTSVIPVTPAQPQPINGGEPYNDHPWCRKRLEAMGVLVCAGMVLAAALLVAGIVIGAVVF